ncbi:hypothetical protein, partial [Trabulsiella guamensis]|uniref:hypothetical protein n=1 Tax=Trabulsiella guamensis TaxID=158852 RepID=UPI001B80A208
FHRCNRRRAESGYAPSLFSPRVFSLSYQLPVIVPRHNLVCKGKWHAFRAPANQNDSGLTNRQAIRRRKPTQLTEKIP